jgi:hypothetical protein
MLGELMELLAKVAKLELFLKICSKVYKFREPKLHLVLKSGIIDIFIIIK